MRIRKATRVSAYPDTVVRVMHSQIYNTKCAISHHFKMRHSAEWASKGGNAACKNWCEELKRIDASSGYSTALAALKNDHPLLYSIL